jgi:hypothetical protein
VPPPGTGNTFVNPNSLTTNSTKSPTVVDQAKNIRYLNPSWISGTLTNDKNSDKDECRETSLKSGVCKCEVKGKAEKCREASVAVELVTKGATLLPGSMSPALFHFQGEH